MNRSESGVSKQKPLLSPQRGHGSEGDTGLSICGCGKVCVNNNTKALPLVAEMHYSGLGAVGSPVRGLKCMRSSEWIPQKLGSGWRENPKRYCTGDENSMD